MVARAFAAVLAVLVVTPLRAQTPPAATRDTGVVVAGLADSDVAAAITLGQERKNKKTFGFWGDADCSSIIAAMNGQTREYYVLAQGPYGRIVDASAQAARKYMPFGRADVSAEMRAPTLTVAVQQNLFDMKTAVVPVEHVVIRGVGAEGQPLVVQPTHIAEMPAYYQNLLGAKIETKGVFATFDPQALPPGELQIVVILSDKECHATIKDKDRDKIR